MKELQIVLDARLVRKYRINPARHSRDITREIRYTYMHIHTHTHTRMHARTRAHTHTHTHTHIHTYTHAHAHTHRHSVAFQYLRVEIFTKSHRGRRMQGNDLPDARAFNSDDASRRIARPRSHENYIHQEMLASWIFDRSLPLRASSIIPPRCFFVGGAITRVPAVTDVHYLQRSRRFSMTIIEPQVVAWLRQV